MAHTNKKETGSDAQRLERERTHFNRIAEQRQTADLVMSALNIRRYDRPPDGTPFPLEYAFNLLGDLRNRTVVELGCGEGLNTVTLASLGARVIAVDISDKSLETTMARATANGVADRVVTVHANAATVGIPDNTADLVLCAAILHHVDCVATAREVHRVLKPGGSAVFLEPLVGPAWISRLKSFLPKHSGISDDEQPLTEKQVEAVSRAVGRGGRRREFLLTTRVIDRAGITSWGTVSRCHALDAWILNHIPFTRALASPLVWEAFKESRLYAV